MSAPEPAAPPRYGRYVGLLALLMLALITASTQIVDQAERGQGHRTLSPLMPPFAVPLALGRRRRRRRRRDHAPMEGAAGRVPACQSAVRRSSTVPAYERGPVVLALFVDSGSCSAIVSDLQALAPSFPGVQFAAVAIKGKRGSCVRTRGLSLPVGVDRDGAPAGALPG